MEARLGRKFFSLLGTFIALASCGPASPGPQAGGGIGGTGNTASVVSGPITGFGSVFVSGYEYDTSATTMTVDGKTGSQNDLKKGMVVLVDATLTHNYGTGDPPLRTANTLVYEDTAEGIVQSVALDGSSLVLLGQTVLVNQTTIIDSTVPVMNLVPGRDLLEVSGFVTGDGTMVATLVSLKSGTPDYEVKGFIKNHVAAQKTFEIGSLTVDYSNADLKDMPGQSNNAWNGLLVDVRGGQVSAGAGLNGVLMVASRMKREGVGTEDSEDTEVSGIVTQAIAPGDFYLGNLHVRTNQDTTFEGGAITDIIVGAYIEVEGPLVSGIVNATKVEFEGETELQANIAAINPNDDTMTLVGLGGLTIQFDSQTALSGQGNPRRIGDLHSGDHLQIHGQLRGGNVVLAKEVERSDPKSTVKVQGAVTSAADPLLALLGSAIDTSSIPENGFRGPYGPVGRSAFFNDLMIGQEVTLQGNVVGTSVVWTAATRKH